MMKKELLEKLNKHGFSLEILRAFSKVKREDFVPLDSKQSAYEDIALPLEKGATISQPYTIAFMLNLLELKRGQKILEIGSGCGYVLALLSEITSGNIYGVEIIKSLAEKSKRYLKEYGKIKIYVDDGSLGLKMNAPFDRILISASASKMPEDLYGHLNPKGIMVVPVKNSIWQIKKKNGKIIRKEFPGFVFVPLIS